MSVVFSDFGVTPDGRRVLRAEIANGELKAAVISYGAALARGEGTWLVVSIIHI